mgnify:CR=1 FL=1
MIKADILLKNILNIEPNNFIALNIFGILQIIQNKHESAIAYFDSTINLKPDYFEAWYNKGNALQDLKRYDEAINHYEITLSIDDPTAFALLRIGECHLKLRNDELGIKFLKKAIHEDPLLDKSWLALCGHYIRNKSYAKVLHYIKKAIKISQKQLLGIQDLSISDVNYILSEAKQFISLNKSKNRIQHNEIR